MDDHPGATRPAVRGPDRRWTDPRVLLVFAAIVVAAVWLGFAVRPISPSTDSAEASYVRDMMQHHGQAVAMAETIRRSSNHPVIRSMAVDIELTQQAQIGQIQGWLDQWQLPATGAQPHTTWMACPSAA